VNRFFLYQWTDGKKQKKSKQERNLTIMVGEKQNKTSLTCKIENKEKNKFTN
jgi:hypothetical protein